MSAAPAQASLLGGLTTGLSGVVGGVTNTAAGVVATTPLAPLAPVVQNLNVVPANYDPVAPLVALVGGQVGPLTAVNQLLCPPLTKVAQLVASLGQPAIASGITTIACSTGILEYKFVTHFKKPDGSILEKTFSATFGVPTLLDVTGDGIPDYIGTLTLTGTNSIGLTVDRMVTNTGLSPTEIEAVVSDPGQLLLGNRALRFGFDSTMDNAPQEFVLSTPLNTLLAPSSNFTASISQKTPGAKVALVAGTFQGTYDARVNPIDLSLLYGNSPTAASISATIGDHDVITLSQNTIGQLTANGHIVNGTEVQDFNAVITNIAAYLSLDIATGNTISANYTSSARVATIRATLLRTHVVGSTATILQKAILNLDDVPIGIQLALANGTNNGTITTTGGPIGLTKIGLANGEPKFLTDAAYADVDNDGTIQSVSAQIPGLEKATFTLTPKITLSATLTATPFRVRVAQPGRVLDAHVNNVPHQIDIGFDPTALTLDYDGHGSGIGQITVAGDSTPVGSNPALAFFGRATKLRANIQGIPSVLHAALSLTAGGGSITASAPINSIEILASNGPEIYPAGTGQGIVYHDVPNGEYNLAARILGFQSLTFDTSHGASISANTAGGPFTLDLLTGTLKATGLIQDLPAQTTLDYNTAAGTLSFTGKKADNTPVGINTLTLDAQSLGGGTLIGAADHLNAVITGIPATETLTLDQATNHFGVTANPAIPKIEIVAANRVINRIPDLPNTPGMGLKYIDQAGLFLVSARVLGLTKVTADTGTPISLFAQTSGGPFRADIATGNITADAEIADLPAKTTLTANLAGGEVTFKGRNADDTPAGINTIDVNASSTTPLFGRATNLKAHIAGVPSDLTLDFAQSGSGVSITANNPISLVEIGAANRALSFPADLPAGGAQGINFTDLTGGDYVIGARVLQITKLAATLTDPISVEAITAGGPFLINATTSTLTAHAAVLNLPAHLLATLSLAQGKLTLNGFGQGIAQVTADAHSTTPLFGRATDVNLNIQGIPSSVEVDLAQSASGISVTADNPISLIEVVAANRTPNLATDLPLAGEQGLNFVDQTGGDYLIGARLKNLTLLGASFDSSLITLDAKTDGGPFGVHVLTDALSADARIENLPQDLHAAVDLTNGHFAVTSKDSGGNLQPIARITLNLTSATPVFGGAKSVAANIEGIPGDFVLDLAQDASGLTLDTHGNPIDLLEIAAQEAPITDLESLLPSGAAPDDQGATYHDGSTSPFLLAVRIRKLNLVHVSLADAVTGGISFNAKTLGGHFAIDVAAAGITSTGFFDKLPADVSLGLDQNTGELTFDGKDASGNPQGVDHLNLQVASTDPFFSGARKLSLDIVDLSPHISLNLANSGNGGSITADCGAGAPDPNACPITSLEILASSDPAATFPASIPAGEQGVVFHQDTPAVGDFLLAARLLDLRSLTFGLSGTSIGLTSNLRSTPFSVDIDAPGLDATANITNLPQKTTLDFDLDNGHFTFDGKDESDNPVGIDSITFGADADPSAPLFGAATKVRGSILMVPPHMDIGFDQTNGVVNLTTSGGAIGTLDFLASNDPAAAFRTGQGITFRDVTDDNGTPGDPSDDTREFNLSAKVLGLQTLQAGIAGLNGDDPNTPQVESGAISLNAVTAGGPFDLDIASDTFSATGTIDDLPPVADIEADLGAGAITFDGHGNGIALLQLAATSKPDSPIFGRANHLALKVVNLPQHVTVGISQPSSSDPNASTNTGASIEATDPAHPDENDPLHFLTITQVEISAWNDTAGQQLPIGTDQGIIYRDVDTDSGPDTVGPFAIGARINNLKKLSADFGDALNLQTVTAGGPFHANIQTQSFSDDPTPVESGLSADVDILDLPATFNLQANLGSDPVTLPDTTVLAPGSISYAASSTIGELKAEIGSVTPLISNANHFNIDLQSLPSSATIGVAPDSGALTLSAGGGTIGQVDIKARDDGSPAYPGQAGGDPNADSAFLDGTGGHFLLNARIFNLQQIAVTLSPINLHAQVGGTSRPFHADIKLPPSDDALAADPGAPNTHATLDVLNLPSTLDVGIVDIPTTIPDPAHPDPTDPAHFKSGGTQITYNAVTPISELKIHADGISLLAGASSIDADLHGVPKLFAMQLPDTTVLTTAPLASLLIADRVAHPTNPVTSTDQIDEMQIAAGSKTLADVPHTTGNDKFLYNGTTTAFGVGVRLTGVKALSMNLDPVNLSIDQNVATTKIIDLDATLPQDTPVTIPPTPPLPNSTVTGTLNKPTGHTELGVTLVPGAPTQLTLKNGDPSLAVSPGNANQTMTSLTLNLANLGAIPAATFSLSHIPKVMLACLATDSSCIRTDSAHATPVFPTWTGPNPCTASPQNPLTQGTGAPKNRPYQPLVSMYFDDTGTSTQAGGPNSAANRSTANMTTMNANITLSATQPHVIVNTLRFHQLSLDLGQQALTNPTSNPPDNTFTYKPIVSISAGQVPRIYMYLDSQKLPFVMTDVEYPPQLPKMVMGTDASPARAFDRISWVPGAVRSSILGCSIGQNISTQSFNSLDCGGAKELDLATSLGNLNAFNLPIFGDVLNICGGTVPTT